jgi:hypothetical protein
MLAKTGICCQQIQRFLFRESFSFAKKRAHMHSPSLQTPMHRSVGTGLDIMLAPSREVRLMQTASGVAGLVHKGAILCR